MPISSIQTEILRLLAANLDPESYVAGASPLNRDAPRISGDIDVFHDREERVAAAATADAQTLTAAGYSVTWLRQLPLIYTAWQSLQSSGPLDPKDITARLRAALDQAEAFVTRMPTGKLGLLFLEAGEVVLPDPDRLDQYQTHAGQRRGQWPESPEIRVAMLERYNQKPSP